MIHVIQKAKTQKDRHFWKFIGPLFLALFFIVVNNACGEERIASSGWVRAFRFGVAAHDIDGLWSGSSKEKGPDICAEIHFSRVLFRLFSATAYPNAGISINSRGDTSKVYAGGILEWKPAPLFFLSTGLGLTLHSGNTDTREADRKSLGSSVLFRIPIEIGIEVYRHQRVIVAFDHISNAYLATPNEGMDTLGLMYAYQF